MKKVALALLVSMAAAGTWAADAAAGQAKSAVCVACHGANGVSVIPIYPNIAGQHAAYLESAMKAYKSQERAGSNAAIMYPMMAPLSDEDIADLAAYYASLPAGGN